MRNDKRTGLLVGTMVIILLLAIAWINTLSRPGDESQGEADHGTIELPLPDVQGSEGATE